MTASGSSRRIIYWVVGLPLLAILGFAGGAYFTATTVSVPISADCKVASDTYVGALDNLIWTGSNPQIYAHFPASKTPFHLPLVVDAYVGKTNLVTADAECVGSFFHDKKKCYFHYDVYIDGKKCGDPGVHVGPPGSYFLNF